MKVSQVFIFFFILVDCFIIHFQILCFSHFSFLFIFKNFFLFQSRRLLVLFQRVGQAIRVVAMPRGESHRARDAKQGHGSGGERQVVA